MTTMQWRPADFFRETERGVQCTLCPHACLLAEGETGYCQVRRRQGRVLETATFATTVRHLDPIERKPLYHFLPGCRVLTLAAPGCSFRCRYCQNFRISQFGRSRETAWQAVPTEPAQIGEEAERLGAAAVAFSYAEPSLAAELTLALAALEPAPRVVWKTNGFLTRTAAQRLAPHLAAVNIDLKSPDERAHQQLTGAPLAPVLDAIEVFLEAGVWVEIATPLIPGINSDPASIEAMARRIHAWGAHIPWHLIRFSPEFKLRDRAPTRPDQLATARAIAREVGLWFVYVERALDEAGRETRCPGCDSVLVSREIQGLDRSRVTQGRCPGCNLEVPGRWVKGGRT